MHRIFFDFVFFCPVLASSSKHASDLFRRTVEDLSDKKRATNAALAQLMKTQTLTVKRALNKMQLNFQKRIFSKSRKKVWRSNRLRQSDGLNQALCH